MRYIISDANKVGAEVLFTTAKDAVKVLQFKDMLAAANLKCLVLKIQFEIEVGKDVVLGRVHQLLGR